MRETILSLLLAAVSGTAWAQQWVRVSTDTNDNVFYVDTSTIKKSGHVRRFWELVDLPKPDKDGDLSYRTLKEVDCKEERDRILQGDAFRGQMGDGAISGSANRPGEWEYAAPGTPAESIMKFVCSR